LKIAVALLGIAFAKIIEPDGDGTYRIRHQMSTNSFSWLVLGDWGGWPAPLYNSPTQLSVAASMTRTSRLFDPKWILSLGDNFYYWGVQNIEDPMWDKTFEEVYSNYRLHVPWYPTTGNHDWDTRPTLDGNIIGGNATAQLLYSRVSDRWTYPDLFYTVDSYLPNGMKQRIIMIDTPSLSGVYSTRPSDQTEDGDPADPEYAQRMWNWIEHTLEDSEDFNFLFVAGHYMTIDSRGIYDRCLVGKLLPLMEKYNVQGYIQGHRHTMEHVQQPKGQHPSDLHFFTIGAGALYCTSCIKKDILGEIDMNIACNREDNLKDDVFCHFFWSSKTTAGGYAYFTTSEEGVKVEYIESDYDKIIYETLIPPRFK